MRIGIYGGTFDPPHKGHLYLANEAKRQLELDELWMVVSGNPPHKDKAVSPRLMRYDMCRLAVSDCPGIILKDYEMNRSSDCYSYELLSFLKEKYSDDELFFLMGEDSLELFDTWYKPEIIAACANLVVAVRNDDNKTADSLEPLAKTIEEKYRTRVILLRTKNIPVSSSGIREAVAKDESIDEFVSASVSEYIKAHRMYSPNKAYDIETLTNKMRESLGNHRFLHSVGVMDTAAALAMRYNYPMDIARVSGILHDCAKKYDNAKLLKLCDKYGLGVTESEEISPHLLHAKVGAYLACNRFGVDDPEILHSIETHTTGEPEMSLLGKIIFVADYIEPMRDRATRLEEIRQIAFSNLDLAVFMILEDTLSYLKQRNCHIDGKTVETYEYYKSKCDILA